MNRTDTPEPPPQPTGQDQRTSTRDARREARSERARIEIDRLRAAGRNLGAQLQEQARKRPFVVMGAAAGLGFVAGSMLGTRLGQLVLAAGIGYAAKDILEGEFGVDRITEGVERLARERAQG